MTMAVIIDERANINALAVRTALRASETPVRREMTTKMLSGTRNNEESWSGAVKHRFDELRTGRTNCCTMLVRDERPSEGTLDGIIHPYTRFEETERPEPHVFIVGRHARRQRECTDRTDDAA